jgi:hypothetical protein
MITTTPAPRLTFRDRLSRAMYPVRMPAAATVGSVPAPNAVIKSAPWTAPPAEAAVINMEYTNPHGNQPQMRPNSKAWRGLLTGSNR